MLQINLLEEYIDNTAANIVESIVYFAALGMVCLVCFIVQISANQSLDLETKTKMTLTASLQKLTKQTKHVEELEEKEQKLSKRLTTIARLKALQKMPILLLNEITDVIPERAWLTALTNRKDTLDIKGVAFDNQTISMFMSRLEKSVFVKQVILKFSQQYKNKGVDLKQFELKVPLYNPLKARKRFLQRRRKIARMEKEAEERKKLEQLTIDNRTEEEKAQDLDVVEEEDLDEESDGQSVDAEYEDDEGEDSAGVEKENSKQQVLVTKEDSESATSLAPSSNQSEELKAELVIKDSLNKLK